MPVPHPDTDDGPRDAARRLAELLWEPERTGRRGPKPALSRDAVIDAAVGEADAHGLEALSMRAVAERLGTSTTGLYRYVPGRIELIALMVEQVTGEQAVRDDDGDWRERLTRYARRDWQSYHQHPWLLDVPSRRIPPGPTVTAKYDAGLAAALDTGVSASEAVAVFLAVDHLVIGAARASTENAALTRQTGLSISDWWTQQGDVGLFDRIGEGRFPALATVLDSGGFDHDAAPDELGGVYAAAFERALTFLLDGIAERLAAN